MATSGYSVKYHNIIKIMGSELREYNRNNALRAIELEKKRAADSHRMDSLLRRAVLVEGADDDKDDDLGANDLSTECAEDIAENIVNIQKISIADQRSIKSKFARNMAATASGVARLDSFVSRNMLAARKELEIALINQKSTSKADISNILPKRIKDLQRYLAAHGQNVYYFSFFFYFFTMKILYLENFVPNKF